MKSIKVCEYSRSRSFHDDLILHDQLQVSVLRTNGPLVIVNVLWHISKVSNTIYVNFNNCLGIHSTKHNAIQIRD